MLKSLHSTQTDVFLNLLRDTRVSVRLRQSDLAMRLGRCQGTVSKVERGERRLDVMELRAWLNALEVDFVAFVAELEQRLLLHPVPDARLRAASRVGFRHRAARASSSRRCD